MKRYPPLRLAAGRPGATPVPHAAAAPASPLPPRPEAANAEAIPPRDAPPVRLALAARVLHRIAQAGVALSLLIVLIFTVGQVLDRYLLKTTFDTYDQFARIGLVWLTFLGIAAGIRDRANVRIELLNHFAPQRLRAAVSMMLDLFTLAITVTLVVVGYRLLEVGAFQTIMGTSFSYDVMYLGLLAGLGLVIACLVLRVLDRATRGRFRLDEPEVRDDHRD